MDALEALLSPEICTEQGWPWRKWCPISARWLYAAPTEESYSQSRYQVRYVASEQAALLLGYAVDETSAGPETETPPDAA